MKGYSCILLFAEALNIAEMPTCICIIGVGFVGESLLKQFGKVYNSIGFDISEERIRKLRSTFRPYDKVQLTSNAAEISVATHFFVAVPTLLKPDRTVDLGYVETATETVLTHAAPGSCIVIESSVPVGTTRRLLGAHQHNFHCGMSPERIDPGRVSPSAEDIPKLVSALTPTALESIISIYSSVYHDVRGVTKPEVAEMTKLYENCYRMINVAYVNEVSDACRTHDIDPYEMINAAASKPFGFQAFYPGLGVGGHCIPVNPYYMFENNKHLPMLEAATKIMINRPRKLARRFHKRVLSSMGRKYALWPGTMPRILVVGIGFKTGQSDISGSPAIVFAEEMSHLGCARLSFYDPLVTKQPFEWLEKLPESKWNASHIDEKFDGVYISNAQDKMDFSFARSLRRAVVGSYVQL